MQSIICKYLGPTNTKPARIKATADGGAGSLTVSRHFDGPPHWDALRAAGSLAAKLGWTGEMIQVELDKMWVHVFTEGIERTNRYVRVDEKGIVAIVDGTRHGGRMEE